MSPSVLSSTSRAPRSSNLELAAEASPPEPPTVSAVDLRLLFEHAFEPQLAWERRDPRRIVLWNLAAQRLYGFAREVAIGSDPRELLATQYFGTMAAIDRALDLEGQWAGELRHRTAAGEEVLVQTRLRLVRGADGRDLVLESGRDVTTERRQEGARLESERRLALALAAGRTGIWEWFVTSGRAFVSPEASEIFGLEAGEAEPSAEDLLRLLVPEDRDILCALGADDAEAELVLEFRIRRPDGAVRWIHSLARVDRDATGRAWRFVGTIRDVTREHDLMERLANSEAAYRGLANALPQLVWSTDGDAKLEWLNDRWVALTGRSAAETMAENWHHRAIHPDDYAGVVERWREGSAAGAPWEAEYRLRNADGVYRWYFARAVPVCDVVGRVTRWVGSATDIHDRRCVEDDLRKSERRWRTLFHLSPLPSTITRVSDRVILDVNEALVQKLGLSRDALIGRTAVDVGLVTPSESAHVRDHPHLDHEFVVRTREGGVRTLVVAVSPIDHAGEPCMLAVGNDVTDQRAAERALREADRRKDEFLAILSHELRSPLAPILTAVHLMARRGDRANSKEREVIERQVRHMIRLVDDLSDVSRVSLGKVVLETRPLEVAWVVARAVEASGPLIDGRGHTLELSVAAGGALVHGDEVRLTQVFTNLLTNAARYTASGGHIRVSGGREGDQVVVRVRDDGTGIDPALISSVFDMFVQGARQVDGLGLGLALVQRLTALHGGTVEARSDGPGRGSEFTIRLPAAQDLSDPETRGPPG